MKTSKKNKKFFFEALFFVDIKAARPLIAHQILPLFGKELQTPEQF